MLVGAAVLACAQTRNTGTDLKFHKFKPKVSPEQAARAQAAQTPAEGGMSALAAQQMLLLQQEKSSRTPAQRKIDSNVLYTLRMLQGQPAAPGVDSLNTGIELDARNNVVVDIVAYVSEPLLQQLDAAGGVVLYSNLDLRSIRAIIPPAQIEQIAESPEVIFISPKQGWRTHRIEPELPISLLPKWIWAPGLAERAARVQKHLGRILATAGSGGTVVTGQGSVTTEGDLTHRAFDARGAFGTNGAGLKIGVLSDGVSSLDLSAATGDLPPNCAVPPGTQPCVTVLPGQTGSGDEGTAILEIIYDMAPGARLYFATADNSIASFAQNIRDLRSAGCDIIVDDVFYFVETPFQDGQTATVVSTTNGGVVTQAVNDVAADGALYFSSAGNEGNLDDGTSGTYEGDFNPIVSGGPLPTGNVHDFGGPMYDVIGSSGLGFVGLWWADPLGGSSNDYDLFVLDSTGTAILASSTNVQSGTQDPFEAVASAAVASGNRLVVFQNTGAGNRFFHVGNLRGTLAVNTTGETHGHSAGSGAYTVAATPAAVQFGGGSPTGPFPDPFDAGNQVELFTSDGPRRIFFNGDSSAITPGNFTSTGGSLLSKPDVTAADGVSVTGVGGFGSPFFGTSAAAPSAAAVAALVKSAQPTLTPAQIRAVLTSTAIDIMGAGFDRDSGDGIVMAWDAVNSLGVPGSANPELGMIAAVENPGNGNGILEAGEGGQLTIQLRNTSGVQDATAITATLTTSTAGVTITRPGTSAYADMPAGSGAASNLTPYTFTVASNAACGLTIDFTLTVTYSGGPVRTMNFSVPTGMLSFNNNLGTTPAAVSGVTTLAGTQTNRVLRNGMPSTCAGAKAFPGSINAASRVFDSYRFTACRTMCLSAGVTSANAVNIFEVAYSPSFDPANIATNYAGDAGASSNGQTCAINILASTPYTLVVHDVPGTAVGTNYTLQIPACVFNCNTNQVPVAVVHDVTVTAPTVGGTANASIDNGSSDPDDATNTLTITQTPAGPYPVGNTSVMLTVTDPEGATAQDSATVTVVNPDDFTLAPTLPSVTVVAGASATEHITFTPNPATDSSVTFSCSGLPAESSCSFMPPTVPPASAPVDVVLTVTTTAENAAALRQPFFNAAWLPFTGLGVMGIVVLGIRRNRKSRGCFATLTILLVLTLLPSCGNGQHSVSGTPKGTYMVTVTGTSARGAHSTTFSLTVN